MARQSDHEKETLRISADAATKLLVTLGEERERLDLRIKGLQAIIDGYETLTGKRTKIDVDTAEGSKKRAPKGQVLKHVEEILHEGEQDEPGLRKAIQDKFGVVYGRATVYACLRRGASDHKFIQDGKRWSLNPLRAEQPKS